MNLLSHEPLSLEELVSTILHTSLPTVIVEGKDDMTFYNCLETELQDELFLLPVGGRNNVLELFKMRTMFRTAVVFIVDRDMWIFSKKPKGLADLVVTQGFSIENDVLDEGRFFTEVTSAGKEYFEKMRVPLIRWFSYQVQQYKQGKECCLLCSINQLIDKNYRLSDDAIPKDFVPNPKIYRSIEHNFWLQFRGKTLLDICFRALLKGSKRPHFTKHQYIQHLAKEPPSPRKKYLLARIAKQYRKETQRLNTVRASE